MSFGNVESFISLLYIISYHQFSVSLAVPGLTLAVVGRYISTIVLLYVLGMYALVYSGTLSEVKIQYV